MKQCWQTSLEATHTVTSLNISLLHIHMYVCLVYVYLMKQYVRVLKCELVYVLNIMHEMNEINSFVQLKKDLARQQLSDDPSSSALSPLLLARAVHSFPKANAANSVKWFWLATLLMLSFFNVCHRFS